MGRHSREVIARYMRLEEGVFQEVGMIFLVSQGKSQGG